MSTTLGNKRSRQFLKLGFTVVLALAFTPAIHGQFFRGFISGTVTDIQSAVVMGAQVTVRNQETNSSHTMATNAAGFYRFAAVEPGVYTVEIAMDGFQTQKFGDIRVGASQEPIVNAALRPVAAKIEVNVVAPAGAELSKTTPAIERTLPSQVITEIPLSSGREVTRFALLAPTVGRAPGSNEFSANGQRARNANFTIDGVDNNDNAITTFGLRTPPEAVREFQIQTTPFSAEFGRNTGPQVTVITKNGANRFHGEIWDYYRGNWLEPLSLTSRSAGLTESPRLVNNQFGADVGGPIIKDKMFFFGMVQGNLVRQSPDARNATAATIPTPAGFAALQGAPLRAGQSPESRQAALTALGFLPDIHAQVKSYSNLRNITINGTPIEVGTIRIPIAQPQDLWYSVARIDRTLNNGDQLSYRYHLDNRNQPNLVSNVSFGPKWAGDQHIQGQRHDISYTTTRGSHFVNEARAAYSRRDLDFPEHDPVSPTIQISNFFTINGLNAFPQRRLDQTYQFQNISTYLSGRHSVRFGVDLHRDIFFNRAGANAKGTWGFTGLDTFMNNTSSLTQAVTEAQTFTAKQLRQYYFVQDDWKARRDLTVNLGLRYETTSIPFGMFGATLPEVQAVGVPGPTKRDTNNWGPRVGFAYSPNASSGIAKTLFGEGKSSIRGGFGIAYDVLFENILINTAGNYPRSITQNDFGLIDVFPTLRPKTATVPALDPTAQFANTPVNAQNPTTNYWTLSVQRQFGMNTIVEVGYTGNRSYHMIRQFQANPAIVTQAQADAVLAAGNANVIPSTAARRVNPAWGARVLVDTTGKGEYHAGYVKFDKKFSHGWMMGANYTWSANFSDSDEPLALADIGNSSPQVPQDFRNLRNEWSRSIFDRPHRFAVHYVYQIPWFVNSPEMLTRIFGGWQAAGFTEFQSGQPFTIRVGVDTLGNAASSSFPPGRPNYNPGGILIKDPDTGNLRTFTIPLNGTGIVTAPCAAVGGVCPQNGPFTFLANSMPFGGNLGRNTFRGPGFQNWDVSLMKKIAVREGWQVQLRGDFINALNHDNFQNPVANMNSPVFGANTATPLTDAREVLMTVKIAF